MTWGGTIPGKSLKWAYDEITSISDNSDRLIFIFSDFVLTQPGEENEQNIENYKIIERMLNQGVKVCACISPLANKSIFKPYTRQSLTEMKKIGVYMADTYRPSIFLDQVNDFFSQDN